MGRQRGASPTRREASGGLAQRNKTALEQAILLDEARAGGAFLGDATAEMPTLVQTLQSGFLVVAYLGGVFTPYVANHVAIAAKRASAGATLEVAVYTIDREEGAVVGQWAARLAAKTAPFTLGAAWTDHIVELDRPVRVDRRKKAYLLAVRASGGVNAYVGGFGQGHQPGKPCWRRSSTTEVPSIIGFGTGDFADAQAVRVGRIDEGPAVRLLSRLGSRLLQPSGVTYDDPADEVIASDLAALEADLAALEAVAYVQGGNSFGATARLGTNDAYALEIETNGTRAVSISTTQVVTFHGTNAEVNKDQNTITYLAAVNQNNSGQSSAEVFCYAGTNFQFIMHQGGSAWSTAGNDVRNGGASCLISYQNIPQRFVAENGSFGWYNGFNYSFNQLARLDSTGLILGAYGSGGGPNGRLDVRGTAIFNEDGDSTFDVRIEGDTDTHLLFTDASEECVGFGESAPACKVSINGGLGIKSATASLNTTDPTLTVGNRSFIILTLGALAAGNITLSDGRYDGQVLVIKCESNSGTAILPDSTTQNVKLSADWNPTADDMILLIWDAADDDWMEITRSSN